MTQNNSIDRSDHQWMVIYSTYDFADAHIVAGRLRVEGIQVLVHRQAGAGAFGITVGQLGEINVLVDAPDYDRAISILEPDELDILLDTNDKISYRWEEDDGSQSNPD